jgi:hypothetical protein
VEPGRTLTLALAETGLRDESNPVRLADSGIPATVYERAEIPYRTPFDDRYAVELTPS